MIIIVSPSWPSLAMSHAKTPSTGALANTIRKSVLSHQSHKGTGSA